jgi:hypothetical protein
MSAMRTCDLLAVLALVPSCEKVVPAPERWTRTFGGTNDDEGAAVALCPDGGRPWPDVPSAGHI